MTDIVLATLNAKYAHTAFGLRYLLANMGALKSQTRLCEFTIQHQPRDIAEQILQEAPRLVALGVYVWNALPTLELVTLLKQLAPEVKIILGGPEISYETAAQPLSELADVVITGEADLVFAPICERLLERGCLPRKIIAALPPDLAEVCLPYDLYDAHDIAHRVIYVESTRGCRFGCHFCLSSLSKQERRFPLDRLLPALEKLLERGGRHFKFVDRTFNSDSSHSTQILRFFLDHYSPGMFLHFELVPEMLPDPLRALMRQFPRGVVQCEVGVQTLNPAVAKTIARPHNYEVMAEHFAFLREHTGVHLHADLIVGLPGESLESFAAGFDQLVAMQPQEIQIGILKRLRGAPIAQHVAPFGMIFSTTPPYEILQHDRMSFATLQRLKRMARYWDLVVNRGHLPNTSRLLLSTRNHSAFDAFLNFSDWLYGATGQTHSLALDSLAKGLLTYLNEKMGASTAEVAAALCADYQRGHDPRIPDFLRPFAAGQGAGRQPQRQREPAKLPRRQAQHAAT